ncbi:murein biosynthesis integral membrane protein MurJ [Pseudonocardia ammonioxydans]|uniref:murein biosynthesis integral membrane protein MurJ n=1 Tax=Pseudonocardia ammonioxydans TaxID=260086 RepID=UPI001FE90592|nr:murein biosynthesis integral membrane protein MurJ [Pseudonocardia ammonioxydans]
MSSPGPSAVPGTGVPAGDQPTLPPGARAATGPVAPGAGVPVNGTPPGGAAAGSGSDPADPATGSPVHGASFPDGPAPAARAAGPSGHGPTPNGRVPASPAAGPSPAHGPAQGGPGQAAGPPANGTSTGDTPPHGVPASTTPPHGAPAGGTPPHGSPAGNTPPHGAPAGGTPPHGAPAGDAPRPGGPAAPPDASAATGPVTPGAGDAPAPAGAPDGAGALAKGTENAGSLVRSSGMIAIASMVSRATGFVRNLALVAVLGLAVVNDSYTVSNTLPNIVYEFLIGGVLTSVMIPVLVRAQAEDPDGGDVFTRRLLTVVGVGLLLATLVAMAAAPLLTRLYLGSGGSDASNPELATAFAWLLLPQIFFYGIGALLGAILNSKQVFGPFAWAPVLNNVVVLGVLVVYVLVPGEISTDPVRMGDPKLLVLGLGTTLGIVVQAAVLIPFMRRIGFRYRPVWGWDPRLSVAGGMVVWIMGYVLVGAVGYIVTTRVAAAADGGSVSTYQNAWLLLQVPYGVLGVSLLTALMPRMSRAAANGDTGQVVTDLSLGARLSTVGLVPIAAVMTAFGGALGTALFSVGAASGAGAARLGETVAWSAFGLLPYAVTMLQMRVFYAMTDSRTPTMIQVGMVGVKIPLLLACPLLLPPEDVVLGLAAANGMSFVGGAVLGQWLLRRRLGRVRTGEVLNTLVRVTVASAAGAAIAWGLSKLVEPAITDWPVVAQAWTLLVGGSLLALPLMVVGMRLLKVRELDAVFRRFSRS